VTVTPPETSLTTGGLPVRVLLAEDNTLNRRLVTLILAKIGIRADVASNGRQAVEMFRRRPYDLVFINCRLPELDGFAAAREIRCLEPPGRRVPIVAINADTLPGSRELCVLAGMDGSIGRPVKRAEILSALSQWLKLPAPAPPAVSAAIVNLSCNPK